MKEKTRKLITIILLGLSVIGTVLAVFHAMGSNPKNQLDGMVELGNAQSGLYDIVYWILAAFIFIALICIVVFACKGIKFGKKLIVTLIGAAVIIGLSFVLSSGTDVSSVMLEKYNTTEDQSKLIGAACYIVYILCAAAFAAIVYVEIANSLKKK